MNGDDVLGASYDVIVARLKSAPRPLMIHFLGLFPKRERSGEEEAATAARSAAAGLSAVSVAGPAPGGGAAAAASSFDARSVTGLIGGGVSFGTGATPRPGGDAGAGRGGGGLGGVLSTLILIFYLSLRRYEPCALRRVYGRH